jgi:hypothetical protein
MSSKVQSFTITKSMKEFPSWFDKACRTGKAKVIYDDDENIELVKLFVPGVTYELKEGDKVYCSKHGLVGVKNEATK